MKLLRYNADPINIPTVFISEIVAQANNTLCVYTKDNKYYVGYMLKRDN